MHKSITPIKRCCWVGPLLFCRRFQPTARRGALQPHHSYASIHSIHNLAPQQQANQRHGYSDLQQQQQQPPTTQLQTAEPSDTPQQMQQQIQAPPHLQRSRRYLTWQELHRAAQISAWSGLCYHLPEDLQRRIDQQHLQLTLLAQGRNEYTAWYVADGVIPHAHFCSAVRQHTSVSASVNSRSNAPKTASAADETAAAQTEDAASGPAGSAEAADSVCAVPESVRERFIFMRGVQWSAHDIDSVKLSQALMRMWPSPFPRTSKAASASDGSSNHNSNHNSSPMQSTAAAGAALVAHEGVADIATSLFDQLRPYLDQADDVGMPICLAGHSLGGSLALLTMVLYQTNSRRRQPSSHPTCYTFGSPPVLAHEQGGGGHRALQALGLPPNCVQNFVLENDPVPRAMLSVDPTFQVLKEWSAVKGLLHLRGLLAGQGSPLSPGRFLFESVGQVQLIKWTPEGGSEVVPLDAHEIDSELSFISNRAAADVPAAAGATTETPTAAGVGGNSAAAHSAGAAQKVGMTVASGGLSGIAATLSQFVSPLRGLQAWLDHHHGSYAQELEAAALTGIKKQVAYQQKQQA